MLFSRKGVGRAIFIYLWMFFDSEYAWIASTKNPPLTEIFSIFVFPYFFSERTSPLCV